MAEEKYEYIDQPAHYGKGKQVIDYIEEFGLGFHLGNAFKYIARCGKKPEVDPVEDIKKAIWYLRRFDEHGHKSQVFRTSERVGMFSRIKEVVEDLKLRYNDSDLKDAASSILTQSFYRYDPYDVFENEIQSAIADLEKWIRESK